MTFLRFAGLLLLFLEMFPHAIDGAEEEQPGEFRRSSEYQPEAVHVEVPAACFPRVVALSGV